MTVHVARPIRSIPRFVRNDNGQMALAGARLGGTNSGGALLAAELDAAGCAHGLPVLSALAWIYFDRRCSGLETPGQFALVAFAEKLRVALCCLGAGMVAIRTD